ncbi:DD3-3 [Acrasis kona]|uniref:DD3-3 n=1 Tax=Acrasis kona TaxID=1008807 RepID=A0AAW2ZDR6_9EUKA
MSKLLLFVACVLLVNIVTADIYLHNPRGNNNRNCERGENRQNENRLFDSENNAKGGYACPRTRGVAFTPQMYYYQGSQLQVEWSQQHACGGNVNCQIVLQYMCEDTAPYIRDGIPTDITDGTGTNTPTAADINNPDVGFNESPSNLARCKARQRNGGLYTADQTINGQSAVFTRQNPNGQTSGLECQEERDYYPYWHPSPWKDIAIFTTNVTMCPYYQAESQNVMSKGECVKANGDPLSFNQRQTCLSGNGIWNVTEPYNIAPPDCLPITNVASRDNHLGSVLGGQLAGYNWTIPNDIRNTCVLRIRYNISSSDFNNWEIDSSKNGANAPVKDRPYMDFGLSQPLGMAINTDQLGRTFQDRTYTFGIKQRPSNIRFYDKIYNLNVRGKRGNIVQTFPAVEYDFVPNFLMVQGGDYVHLQWTGSDYNPNRNPNDGEGGPFEGSDRHNFVQTDSLTANIPRLVQNANMFKLENGDVNATLFQRLALLDQNVRECLNITALRAKNNNNEDAAGRDRLNCGKLNNVGVYFDAGLIRQVVSGKFSYMSTRNNNFSNRSQKGLLVVQNGWYNSAYSNKNTQLALVVAVLVAVIMVL